MVTPPPALSPQTSQGGGEGERRDTVIITVKGGEGGGTVNAEIQGKGGDDIITVKPCKWGTMDAEIQGALGGVVDGAIRGSLFQSL